MQYFPHNGTCQLLSVGGHQIPASYQPVSLMVPVGQDGQSKYIPGAGGGRGVGVGKVGRGRSCYNV